MAAKDIHISDNLVPNGLALSKCTCMGLRKAARAVTQAFDSELRSVGLRSTQFSILSILVMGGAKTIGELSKYLVTDSTTLTRNLRPLERDGLIAIATGEDRRTRVIAPTAAGEESFAKALPLWQGVQERLIQKLGDSNWNTLLETLDMTVKASQD
ncbi:MAG: winged helix-turn-helix transcriptional regulator [Alphaproteobacteria bacterium]|nr:winged helix-turn-helix transcriptional regulator [Alphaproteobacteria bacterium]